MSKIKIEWLSDTSQCETCGMSWAEGARVIIDGDVAFEMVPVAHCFGGTSFTDEEVYSRLLAHLGYELEQVA